MLYGHQFLITESYYINNKKCKNLLEKAFINGIIQEGLYCFECNIIYKEDDIEYCNLFSKYIKSYIHSLRESKIAIKKDDYELAKQKITEASNSLTEANREINNAPNEIKMNITDNVLIYLNILINNLVLYIGTILKLKVVNSVIESVGGNLNMVQPIIGEYGVDFNSISETKIGKDIGKCICMIKDIEKDHDDILSTYIQISSIIRLLIQNINELSTCIDQKINKRIMEEK